MIYLDNAATTKVDPRVVDEMLPYFSELYGNASSKHKFGGIAYEAVNKSREQVANLIGSKENEIVFTSGATEGINLAIKGIFEKFKEKGNHIITVKTEHSAVLDTCRYLESKGGKVTYLNVDKHGIIDLEELKNTINNNTILVSVMYVNNEIGVIQPIEEISNICHDAEVLFMSDATQAVGKIPIDVYKLGIDLMPFSAHKFHGPKGIGGLFVRKRRPFKVKLETQIHGGGHQNALRSGTLNVPLIVGLGKVSEIIIKELSKTRTYITEIGKFLEEEIKSIENSSINGSEIHRLPNIINVRFDNIDSDALIASLDTVSLSKGSACSTQTITPSPVLKNLGLSDKEVFSSIRISISKFTSFEDIKKASNLIKDKIKLLRELN